MRFVFSVLIFSLGACAYAAIGPWANMKIVNRHISPDGFERASAKQLKVIHELANEHLVLCWLMARFLAHWFADSRLSVQFHPIVHSLG